MNQFGSIYNSQQKFHCGKYYIGVINSMSLRMPKRSPHSESSVSMPEQIIPGSEIAMDINLNEIIRLLKTHLNEVPEFQQSIQRLNLSEDARESLLRDFFNTAVQKQSKNNISIHRLSCFRLKIRRFIKKGYVMEK